MLSLALPEKDQSFAHLCDPEVRYLCKKRHGQSFFIFDMQVYRQSPVTASKKKKRHDDCKKRKIFRELSSKLADEGMLKKKIAK